MRVFNPSLIIRVHRVWIRTSPFKAMPTTSMLSLSRNGFGGLEHVVEDNKVPGVGIFEVQALAAAERVGNVEVATVGFTGEIYSIHTQCSCKGLHQQKSKHTNDNPVVLSPRPPPLSLRLKNGPLQ